MDGVLIPVYLISTLYSGIYLEPDTNRHFRLNGKQVVLNMEKPELQLPYNRPTLENKNILIGGYYETTNND